jgi:hypothetical protein
MKKLSLHLDHLHVETFELLPAAGRRAGTVLGRGETDQGETGPTCGDQQTCFPPTCLGMQTCNQTCPQTCLNSCDGNTCNQTCLDSCAALCVTCAETCQCCSG